MLDGRLQRLISAKGVVQISTVIVQLKVWNPETSINVKIQNLFDDETET